MHPNSRFILRVIFLVGALLGFTLAGAQDVLAPKWVSFGGGVSGGLSVQYSADGSKVFIPMTGGFNVVRLSDGKVLVHEEGLVEYPTLSVDGAAIYYLSPTTGGKAIWKYDLTTRARTFFTGSVNLDYWGPLVLSPNGHTIAWTTQTGVAIFDVATNSLVGTIAISSRNRLTPCFTAGGTKIVEPGPVVYDLTGNLIFGVVPTGNHNYKECSTPDGSKFFEVVDSTMTAYSSVNYSVLWSKPVVATSVRASRDGNSLILTNNPTKLAWEISSISTINGSARAGTIVSPRTVHASSFPVVSVDPNADEILIGSVAEAVLERWSYNSLTGTGGFIAKLADGFYKSDLISIRTAVGGVSIPAFVSNEGEGRFTSATAVRDAATGGLISRKDFRVSKYNENDTYPLAYSPDGAYYMTNTYSEEIGIFRSSDDTLAATYQEGRSIGAGGWVTPTRPWISRSTISPHVRILKFDGSSIQNDGSANEKYVGSPNGNVKVYVGDVITVIGRAMTTPSTIARLSSNPFKLVKFTDNNLLVVNEVNKNTSENTIRIYGINKSVVLLYTYTDSTPGTYRQGTVSNSGLFYAFASESLTGEDGHATGSIKIYRTSDNALVRQWDDQYLGVEITDLVFSADDFVISWATRSGMIVAAVLPPIPGSITFSPSSVPGGTSTTATVTMSRVVNQDTVLHLSTTTGLVEVPTSVTIPAGSSSATFPVATHGVNTATVCVVRCTYGGATISSNLTLDSATALTVTLDRTNIEGVGTATGTITLNAPAGPGGLSVKVTTSKASSATVSPATVVIPANSTTGTFTVTTKNSTADYLVTFTAKTTKFNGTVNLMVARLAKATLSLDKTSITGGDTATLTITRAVAAPTGGLTYQLSSNSGALIPPTQIVLPAGQVTASVTVNTLPVASSTAGTITLASGSQLQTINATVVPPTVSFLSSNPTDVTGNGSVDVTITLNGPAPSGFSLASSSSAAAIVVPASIPIPSGQTSYVLSLAVKKVTADRTVTISIGGKTVTITLHAP